VAIGVHAGQAASIYPASSVWSHEDFYHKCSCAEKGICSHRQAIVCPFQSNASIGWISQSLDSIYGQEINLQQDHIRDNTETSKAKKHIVPKVEGECDKA
jgi:hypothetical protein